MSAHPSPQADPAPPLRGTVLFVHGLWLSGAESFLIRRRLARHGLALRVMPYSSISESMDAVARRCARQALAVAARTNQPVHLVGHSLGGLVIHRALGLGLLEPDRFTGDFCRIVFLGTPVRGSQSARAVRGLGPVGRLLGRVGTDILEQGVPGDWSFPAELGVIAGDSPLGLGRLLGKLETPHDGTVSVCETCIDGAKDRCVLPVTHTGMLLSAQVAEHTAQFLLKGAFPRAAETDAA